MQEVTEIKSITLGELVKVLGDYLYQSNDASVAGLPIYFDGLHINGDIIEHDGYLGLI